MEVIGIGRRTTPEAFRAACNKFIFTETIMDDSDDSNDVNKVKIQSTPTSQVAIEKITLDNIPIEVSVDDKLQNLIKEAIESASEEDGWANLGGVGSCINRIDSSFDSRNFGFPKLSKLIRSLSYIDLEERKTSEGGGSNTYIRLKDSNA